MKILLCLPWMTESDYEFSFHESDEDIISAASNGIKSSKISLLTDVKAVWVSEWFSSLSKLDEPIKFDDITCERTKQSIKYNYTVYEV